MAQAQIGGLETTLSLASVDGVMVPFQNGMPVPSYEKQKRQMLSLKGTWLKQRFSADHNVTMGKRDAAGMAALVSEAAGRWKPEYADAAWPQKKIPAVENAMNFAAERTPETYENGVWYRYRFMAGDSLKGKLARLNFLAVNYVADVWLNGTYLGWHEGGFTPFSFDVTNVLRYDSANVIAVRVDNIPWNPGQTASTGRIDIVPYYKCDWFNYTGIMHDVYIDFSNPVSVTRADVVPVDANGALQVTVNAVNRSGAARTVDALVEIFEASVSEATIQTEFSYELVGSAAQITGATQAQLTFAGDTVRAWRTRLNVAQPKLWSPKNPNLYILKVTLKQSGRVVDEFSTQFGIRTATAAGSKLLLNEKPMFLTGVARHEDHPVYGRSMPTDRIYGDLKLVKSVNANYLRSGHYPNNPYTYLIADRLGIAVMEEIPVWWFDNATVWTYQNVFRHVHQQMFREMVFKDYNRPSVLFWSTCNECYDVNGRRDFIQTINDDLNTNYPDGRLVTESAAADRPGAGDPSQSACDVAGWTMYFGIFHGSTYYAGTRDFLAKAASAYPEKPVMDTEFGYWSTESGSTEATQVTVFNETFKAFAERAAVDKSGVYRSGADFNLAGVTWWCLFDWYTAQQPAPNGYQSMGVYHMDRSTPKKVAPVLSAAYKEFADHSELATGVKEDIGAAVPAEFVLRQNFPNPFNPSTRIDFSLPESGHVLLEVFDMLGRRAAVLVDGIRPAGMHAAEWNAKGFPTGMYCYRLQAGRRTAVKKMILVQ